ncbi:MAG TPA: CoA transferase [Candidatus Binataceae bacterium]|jgi:CoA:oxalate CoA-transferase|nr:CoA transferase [Candidatus Binataceae bacterium]
MTDAIDDGVLAGVRVIDFTNYIAGPIVTRFLADMGAEVIKVELPPRENPIQPRFTNQGPYASGGFAFALWNRGKKSVCLDFHQPRGLDITKELIRRADVVVENFSPGVLDRAGLSYEELRKINPRIVMVSVSGCGQTGPLAHRPGNDHVALALSGVMDLTGYPDRAPALPGYFIADNNGGVHGAIAVCAALFRRERTGRGQHIDISMVEALFHLHDMGLVQHLSSHGQSAPVRMGSHHPSTSPCGIFEARDGYVVITALVHHWEHFVKTIGKPELLSDPRFNPTSVRVQNRLELVPIIEQWLKSFPSRDDALKILNANHILAAPVLSVAQAMEQPQLTERGFIQHVEHPVIGDLQLPNIPLRFSESVTEITGPAPLIGEHNLSVLSSYLGYNAEQVEELTHQGILVREAAVTQRETNSR